MNVMYATQCYEIKSGSVVEFHSETMEGYLFVISNDYPDG